MFLKDRLIETYQKASLDNNNLILENVINRWAHRFGVETMHELEVKNQEQINLIEESEDEENQEQINLIEESEEEENQEQINLELVENVQHQKEIQFQSKDKKIPHDTELINKDIFETYKNKYIDTEELPLPNINNLRKWIKNEKKAS